MKCPMKFNNPCADVGDQCDGAECMWYVKEAIDNEPFFFGCAVAMGALRVPERSIEHIYRRGLPPCDGWR